ncbi:hypothetical protein IV38_GL000564 [Lactobacillus selangorensis]|uniref:Uncharacterized protein n=1 Tax=Lactobacillus selangorensis TaxID=81857 RepID=A0A0R2FXI4_9LACO|nr:hypothetical protein [Lactobacillus selangorensis]KRN29677.1 hypothetical protein IV38_GL000564 [Lactobacillus selangorensis]KRN33794.1 hypothetical protein IV40_GL000104 [Lactobacillus selangorensis]
MNFVFAVATVAVVGVMFGETVEENRLEQGGNDRDDVPLPRWKQSLGAAGC